MITMRRTGGAALASLALTVSAAMAVPSAAAAAESHAAHRPTYRVADSGHHVTLHKGHKIKLNLRTNRDGGFSWAVTKRSGTHTASIARKTVRPYKHKKGTAGFPYHTIYVLKAVRAGSGTLSFTERQPFHKSNVAKRFVIHIRVPHAAKPKPHKHPCTRTSSGSCIQGGEFCPQADYGKSGWDANGRRYVCKGDQTHPHWEIP